MRTPAKASSFQPYLLKVPQTHCTVCGARLYACNDVRRRPLQTLHHRLALILKDKVCRSEGCAQRGKRICPPVEGELPILARRCIGLDVVAWIGEQRTVGKRSMPQIHSALDRDYGISISPRHVNNLFKVFLALVHCVNADHAPLREELMKQGRLILSIDAVQFDATSPALFVVRDTISRRILYSERAPKRDAKHLCEILRKVKDIGVPIDGVVSDKEQVQVLAVAQELPGVPHQYCQTHFLKNVVKQMDDGLTTLAECVTEIVKDFRELEKELPARAKSLGSSESELALAKDLCKAVATGGKASGDTIVNPAALKRFERLEAVVRTAETASGVKLETVSSTSVGLKTTGATKGRDRGSSALLLSVLRTLVGLQVNIALAKRLRRQVDIVRKVAHILQLPTTGTQVKRMVSAYLNKLLKLAPARDLDSRLGDFIRHLNTMADRYWPGLFHCYDVEGLPNNNNDLEREFGSVKRNERQVTGRKSTVGGPIETCAEFFLEAWDALIARPELREFLKDVTDDQLIAATKEMETLSEPARIKRSIQRDPDGFLSAALDRYLRP